MKKAWSLLLFVAIWLGLFRSLSAQHYGVELSAFTNDINTSYFYYNGFEEVDLIRDQNGIAHYHAGIYDVYREAKTIENKAKINGFENTHIMQSNPVTLTNNNKVLTKRSSMQENQLFIKTFASSNESVSIKKEDRQDLEEIVRLMKDDPSLKLRFIRPPASSDAPSIGHLKTISNFLLAKGIAPYRMRIMNTHHDFLTAIDQIAASSSTPKFKNNRILITLINLKEEILLNPTTPSSINELTTSNEELSHFIKAVALSCLFV